MNFRRLVTALAPQLSAAAVGALPSDHLPHAGAAEVSGTVYSVALFHRF